MAALADGDTRAGVDAVVGRLAHRNPEVKQKVCRDRADFSDSCPPVLTHLPAFSTAVRTPTCLCLGTCCAAFTPQNPLHQALKLVTHIGRKGSSDLRRLMARRSGAVRDLLHYRCDPDPFKGDTVWKRVQEYAQEALNAIHGTPDSGVPATHGLAVCSWWL